MSYAEKRQSLTFEAVTQNIRTSTPHYVPVVIQVWCQPIVAILANAEHFAARTGDWRLLIHSSFLVC